MSLATSLHIKGEICKSLQTFGCVHIYSMNDSHKTFLLHDDGKGERFSKERQ